MTPEQLARTAQGFAMTAAYFRIQVDDEVLRLYAEDVSDLPFDEVIRALVAYRKNPKNRFMPLPAQIRDLIEPVESPEEMAREIAARIGGAIVKFGHPNEGEARIYIGPDGWNIVQRSGGWNHLCQNHGVTIDPSSFHAQIRDQLVSSIRHDPDRRMPALESRVTAKITGSIANGLLKPLPWEDEPTPMSEEERLERKKKLDEMFTKLGGFRRDPA